MSGWFGCRDAAPCNVDIFVSTVLNFSGGTRFKRSVSKRVTSSNPEVAAPNVVNRDVCLLRCWAVMPQDFANNGAGVVVFTGCVARVVFTGCVAIAAFNGCSGRAACTGVCANVVLYGRAACTPGWCNGAACTGCCASAACTVVCAAACGRLAACKGCCCCLLLFSLPGKIFFFSERHALPKKILLNHFLPSMAF